MSAPLSFKNVEELNSCLAHHQIDPKKWKGTSLEYYFKEISSGESLLELKDGKLHRRVHAEIQ